MSLALDMGVADDLRDLREKVDAALERLTRLEERHEVVAKTSHEDRVAMRVRVEAIGKDIGDVKKSIDAFGNRIEGGKLVIKWAWWVGGCILAGASYYTGMLQWIANLLSRP